MLKNIFFEGFKPSPLKEPPGRGGSVNGWWKGVLSFLFEFVELTFGGLDSEVDCFFE